MNPAPAPKRNNGNRRPRRWLPYIGAAALVTLIVMGLRAGDSPHGRMGSVTYRVLCVSHAAVLALPPVLPAAGARTAPATSAYFPVLA